MPDAGSIAVGTAQVGNVDSSTVVAGNAVAGSLQQIGTLVGAGNMTVVPTGQAVIGTTVCTPAAVLAQ